jgi:hypothetical protein
VQVPAVTRPIPPAPALMTIRLPDNPRSMILFPP